MALDKIEYYSKSQVRELLRQQRDICASGMYPNPRQAPEPLFPEGVSEWQVMNSMFKTEDKTDKLKNKD